MEIFVHDPENNAVRVPVPFKATVAAVVDGGTAIQDEQEPMKAEPEYRQFASLALAPLNGTSVSWGSWTTSRGVTA